MGRPIVIHRPIGKRQCNGCDGWGETAVMVCSGTGNELALCRECALQMHEEMKTLVSWHLDTSPRGGHG